MTFSDLDDNDAEMQEQLFLLYLLEHHQERELGNMNVKFGAK